MLKTLILLGILGLVSFGSVALFARLNVAKINQSVKEKITTSSKPLTSLVGDESKELLAEPALSREEFLKILEASISALQRKIDAIAKKPAVSPTTPPQTQTQAQTSGPRISYIPIGNTGSGSSVTDFTSVSGHEVTIDPGNYPGYRQMVLETNFRIFQGNGTGEVRLSNKTDGTAILGSLVSTNSQGYSTKTSAGFSLPGESKTYTVQVKSTTGYAVDLQWSRVRVDF